MNIDWSKAPEGATHYMLAEGVSRPWRKCEDGEWFAYVQGDWELTTVPKTHKYFAKPVSAGLPTMPEGATHYCPEFGSYPTCAYKHLNKTWSYWTGFNWHVCREPVGSVKRNLIDVRNSVIELAKALMSLSGDIRQPINASQAAWMAAQLEELGYHKFEIVEGDV